MLASEPGARHGKLFALRVLLSLLIAVLVASACGGSSDLEPLAVEPTVVPTVATPTTVTPTTAAAPTVAPPAPSSDPGPGGYGFDRSDPEAGIANIMAAFATNEATATCVYEAWGDVANVPPAQLTNELMVYEICGTSIFEMMTGDGRFNIAE